MTAIFTALCVSLSGAYCACAAGVQPVAAAHRHACCDHGDQAPAKPGHPHDPARDCPHCDGSAVTAAAQPTSQDAQHLAALMPVFALDPIFDADWVSLATDQRLVPDLPAVAGFAPTLLGLHCALTL